MDRRRKIYSEIRAVDVSGDDGEASSTFPVMRDCEGEQRTLIPERAGEVGTVKRSNSV